MEKFYTGPNTHVHYLISKSKLCLFFLFGCLTFFNANAGNTCGGATAITVGNCDATQVNGGSTGVAASCGGAVSKEEWWSVSLTSGTTYVINYQTTTSDDPVIVVYSGACASLVQVSCTNATGTGTNVVESVSFTPGSTATYFIRIISASGGGNMDGNLCINPPSNDDPSGATTVTPAASCSYTTYTNASATLTTCGTIPAPGCAGYSGGDVWFKFTVPATGSVFLDTQAGTITDGGMALYTGTACGVMTLVSCDDNTGAGNMPQISASGLTAGSTAYVRFWENGNDNNGTFGLCITNPPSNDEPSGATAITPSTSCSYTTYTNLYATGSTCGTIPAPGCAGYGGGDVWFSVVVPVDGALTINSTTPTGGLTDGGMAAYSGTPCGTLTLISCNDNGGAGNMPLLTLTGLTVGSTIYIRYWENGNDNNGTFNLCVTSNCAGGAAANDNCATATTLPVYSSACTTTSGSITCATASTDANSCGAAADDDDVWYKFVATSTSVNITITNVAGTVTDMYHSLYTGTCGSLGAAILCSDPNSSIPTGLTIGQTYYIRVYTATTTSGQVVTFDICITQMSPCGNPTNNDWCSSPASLTKSAASTFTSSTASTYTADTPADLNTTFCGSVQNNSWYQFTASATTETIDITSVSGCGGSGGIQAEVYSITHDANGCCTDFTSVSNCFNPGSVTTGTVTAIGLTVGAKYVLMIDGYSGANCNYVISGWAATGVLPVELIYFNGKNIGNGNELSWSTLSEINNNYFAVERSFDGYNFGSIGTVNGHGTTNIQNNYTFYDAVSEGKNVYYRLKQVDFDGHFEYSSTIVVYYKENSLVHIYPNPSTNTLYLDAYIQDKGNYTIRVIDVIGNYMDEKVEAGEGVNHYTASKFASLAKGAYFVQFISDDLNTILKTEKIIKQ